MIRAISILLLFLPGVASGEEYLPSRECSILQISGDGTEPDYGTIILHGNLLLLRQIFMNDVRPIEEILECHEPSGTVPYWCSGSADGWDTKASVVGTLSDPKILAVVSTKVEREELQVQLDVFEVSDCIELSPPR